MGIFNDIFGTGKTNSLDDNTLIEYCKKIFSVSTYSDIESIVSEYEHFDHPHIFYMAASACQVINQYEKGLPWFKKVISYGTSFPNKFWDTLHSDAIGSSIAKVLTMYNFNMDSNKLGNLFVLGYCFLSNSIEQMGNKAYESLHNRGNLFSPGFSAHNIFYSHKIQSPWVMPMLCEVLAIADFQRSAQGYLMSGNNVEAEEQIHEANRVHERLEDISVAGKDADKYSLEEITDIGKQRHRELFDFYNKDLLLNKFRISPEELDEIFYSISIK